MKLVIMTVKYEVIKHSSDDMIKDFDNTFVQRTYWFSVMLHLVITQVE